VIAVDTNILVYAHREDSHFHAEATRVLSGLAAGTRRWAVPWPCTHEFIAIVTHPRIYKDPTPLPLALQALRKLEALSNLELIGEDDGYLAVLERTAIPAHVEGGAIHDARIAALCLHHGVEELWSADRDFSRFVQLKVRNPLLR
jgi:toxin-antitoxin system PIN domain toxin